MIAKTGRKTGNGQAGNEGAAVTVTVDQADQLSILAALPKLADELPCVHYSDLLEATGLPGQRFTKALDILLRSGTLDFRADRGFYKRTPAMEINQRGTNP